MRKYLLALVGLVLFATSTPAQSSHRNCYPEYRWVYTYYGWQQQFVGYRCYPTYQYHNPYQYNPYSNYPRYRPDPTFKFRIDIR